MITEIIAYIMTFLISLNLIAPLSPVTQVNKSDATATSSSSDFCIMTYNVKVSGIGPYEPKKRAPYVVDCVLKNKPDSVGFQEVSPDWYGWLKDGLKGYAFTGDARNGDGTGESSPVFYNSEKYDCTDSGTFWLSETPDKASKGWDAMYNRVCTYAILRDKQTGFTYAHFNAHFDHIGFVARCESVSLVSQKIASLCPDIPVIFTGDLNDNEGGVMYGRITDTGLRDSKFLAEKSEDSGTYHGYSKITELTRTKPIDFVFVNAYCKSVASYEVLTEKYDGIYSSDHHPLKVMLTLANR